MVNIEKYKKTRIFNCIFIVVYLFPFMVAANILAAVSDEKPEAVYTGIGNTTVILNNLDYNDVKNSGAWAKEAIYQSGAMDIMKGYGDKSFGMQDALTKEQAIAIAYRIVGREGEAQKLAETLDSAKKAEEKKANALSMWGDGYLQLAANEGLISQQDLSDAFSSDPQDIEPGGFYRNAPAQRQEVAEWIARTLKLTPVYGQQNIYNSYNDWNNAKPSRIPYIEAVLQNNIMNGYNGYFNPTKNITRQEMAQIIKNAEKYILPIRNLVKMTGSIEGITGIDNYTSGDNLMETGYNLRSHDGKLYRINVDYLYATPSTRNELSGERSPEEENEFIVYKNGNIGKSYLLNIGDRIEYFITPEKKVIYARTIPGQSDTKYVVGRVVENDTTNASFKIVEISRSSYPDKNLLVDAQNIYTDIGGIVTKYNISNNVFVSIDGNKSDLKSIVPEELVLLKVENNIVNEIAVENPKVDIQSEKGVFSGIVEDNNPKLGYISFFSQGSVPGKELDIRTYRYVNKNNISVQKNHEESSIEDIEPGDTAFVRLDDLGKILSISAVDNYMMKYGKIMSINPETVVVEYEDGIQQILKMSENVPIFSEGKNINYGELRDGDRVKLLLQETGNEVKVKEIVVQGKEHLITNIYKGKFTNIDFLNGKISLISQEVMEKGKFVKTDNKGILQLKFDKNMGIYSKDTPVDITSGNSIISNSDAYLALEKDHGGDERVVFAVLRNDLDTEVFYDDSVTKAVDGSREFSLSKLYNSINYGDGSIVIKDGRLVSGNSISEDDLAYVVANRDYEKGNYYAGVVQINQRVGANNYHIYRGRISGINENKDITMGTFSELSGYDWKYTNTKKTFNITPNTLIKDDAGIVGTRDVSGVGNDSYIDKTVYVVTKDGVNADYISTATYVTINTKGKIYKLTYDTESDTPNNPTEIFLTAPKIYDLTNRIWKDSKDMTLSIPENAIIIKGDKIVKASELKARDEIRVLKKDETVTGDAVIIIVEG